MDVGLSHAKASIVGSEAYHALKGWNPAQMSALLNQSVSRLCQKRPSNEAF